MIGLYIYNSLYIGLVCLFFGVGVLEFVAPAWVSIFGLAGVCSL